jgi:hypothetical protein
VDALRPHLDREQDIEGAKPRCSTVKKANAKIASAWTLRNSLDEGATSGPTPSYTTRYRAKPRLP